MNNLSTVNRAINNIMNKYITEKGYRSDVVFDSRVLQQSDCIMFTMKLTKGMFKSEPFKTVFPIKFLEECPEDNVVNLVCNIFKGYLFECEKLGVGSQNEFDDESGVNLIRSNK